MGVVVRQKEKGKGPWYVFINHQKHRKAIKAGTKAEAQGLAARLKIELAQGNFSLAPRTQPPTFGEYAVKWLETYGETHLKYSTLKSYDSILRNHLGSLRDRPLDQISRADLKELIYAKLKTELTPATVTRIKALVSSVLSHALEDELISDTPASRLGRHIKGKDRKADINPLSRDEAQEFLTSILSHYPAHFPFFLGALRTGLRLGELLALEWGDVDFHGKFIEVRRALVLGRETSPKNGKIRRVDLSDQLGDTLKSHQAKLKSLALAQGWGEIPAKVFIQNSGKVIDQGNLRRRVFYPALAKAGLRRIRIHDLRHTFASLLIQNGESLAYVRDQMGHHSIQITVDTYGHLVPGANREAVNRLDDESRLSGQKSGCV